MSHQHIQAFMTCDGSHGNICVRSTDRAVYLATTSSSQTVQCTNPAVCSTYQRHITASFLRQQPRLQTMMTGEVISTLNKLFAYHEPSKVGRICRAEWVSACIWDTDNVEVTFPVNKFLAFYGTRWFFTATTRVRHEFPPWDREIKATASQTISLMPSSLITTAKNVMCPAEAVFKSKTSADLFLPHDLEKSLQTVWVVASQSPISIGCTR